MMAAVRLLVTVQTDEEQLAAVIYTKNSYITYIDTPEKRKDVF
jgi:hypothetical protein